MSYRAQVDTESIITAIAAALSLAVSGFVLWRQHQAEGRAHFTAEWESPNSIVYVNHGPGAAKDVSVHVESEVRPEDRTVPYIGAFQSMRIELLLALGARPAERIDVSWRDNRRGRQSLPIHLPDPPASRTSGQRRDALEKVVREIARDEANQEIEAHERFNRIHRR